MPLPVSLQDVVAEMQMVSDEMTAYINRKTGELVTLTDDDLRIAEDPDTQEDLEDWQEEMLPKIREVLDSGDFIPLPDKFEIDEWSIMQRFAASQPDPAHGDDLLNAIHGRGAFRLFKILLDRLNLREDWFRFRDEALERIAIEFLEVHEIPYATGNTRSP